jgi:hypothetical protein
VTPPDPQPRPGARARPTLRDAPTRKGQHAVSSHIDAATEAVSENIGAWVPANALDLDMFLAGLPRLFETVASSVATVAERLGSEFPVHPSVPEHLQEIAATVAGMGEFAGEAHAIHRTAHAAEMERIENPRPNEELWDVVENQ